MQTQKRLGDLIALRKWAGASPETLFWLGRLLRDEGVDLVSASAAQFERGTAVYAEADANVVVVQALMARHHILRLPVLERGKLIGIVDLVEVALRGTEDEPDTPPPLASAS
jgi:hypothetical protein